MYLLVEVLTGCFWGVTLIVLGLWWYRRYRNIVRHDMPEAMAMALDSKGLAHLHGSPLNM